MMTRTFKIVAVVGSYRKGGIVDSTVDEILRSAESAGSETEKIYLIDRNISYCTNCRACTQTEGRDPGRCVLDDDMACIIDRLMDADGIILGSPVNVGTVTAVMKTFIERLMGFMVWPWGAAGPRLRRTEKPKKAVIVSSAAAPAIIARLSGHAVPLLRKTAHILGARIVGGVFVGMAATSHHQEISERIRKKAHRAGKALSC